MRSKFFLGPLAVIITFFAFSAVKTADISVDPIQSNDSSFSSSSEPVTSILNENASAFALGMENQSSSSSFNHLHLLALTALNETIRDDIKRIFLLQNPKKKFVERIYYILNWPEDIDRFKQLWSYEECQKIRSKSNSFTFMKLYQKITPEVQYGINTLDVRGDLDYRLTKEDTEAYLLDKYRRESGDISASVINWDLLDHDKIPLKYRTYIINPITMAFPKLYLNKVLLSSIHFHNSSVVNEEFLQNVANRDKELKEITKQRLNNTVLYFRNPRHEKVRLLAPDRPANNYRNMEKAPLSVKRDSRLRNELQSIFEKSFPGEIINLRYFDIKEWPEDVDRFKLIWSEQDKLKIRDAMHTFTFTRRIDPITVKEELGIAHLDYDQFDFDPLMSKIESNKFLKETYKRDLGKETVRIIIWKYFDDSQLPEIYKGIKINSRVLGLTEFFKNPEFIYNIRFKDENSNPKKFSLAEIQEIIESSVLINSESDDIDCEDDPDEQSGTDEPVCKKIRNNNIFK